jgi:translation initiation factor 4E
VGEKQHVLHNDWTIWWDKKTKVSKELPYENAIVELCRFQTIEGFWSTFRWLKNVSDSPRETSYHVFRHNVMPMWENFIHGGCIIVKMKKNGEHIDGHWHTLVCAAIGEYFEEPTLVGVGIGKTRFCFSRSFLFLFCFP